MIIISLYIDNGKHIKKYFVKSAKLIMSDDSKSEKIILENISNEFDGICDNEGREHFLIQDASGGLLYLKYDKEVWKKYNIFINKENKQKISSVYLTESMGVLCGFYAMDYGGSVMLVKHIFSETNLHTVPVVIDLLDGRKDFCLCTNNNGNTGLYYRNSKGERMLTEFDKYFSAISSGKVMDGKNILCMRATNNGHNTFEAYTELCGDYVSLKFKNAGQSVNEKLITFAVAKNCVIAISAKDASVTIRWTENDIVMESLSNDNGKTFSKPKIIGRNKVFDKMREKGIKPGMYCDKIFFDIDIRKQKQSVDASKEFSTINNVITEHMERKSKMQNNHPPSRIDISSPSDNIHIINKLGEIVAEVEKLGKSLDNMCSFLDRLTTFRQSADTDIFTGKSTEENLEISITQAEIGEKNEENIKKFEAMSIDDVLPVKTIESAPNGGELNV